jgi:hypothetical protein
LEAIRKTAKEKALEELPNLEQRIAELQTKTSRVHAAFLFDLLGSETLMMICLCLSSTKNSYNSAGWEEFGIHLGLNPLLIKVKRDITTLCVYALAIVLTLFSVDILVICKFMNLGMCFSV